MQLAGVTGEGVKIYNVSAGKSLPEWLAEKKKAALRYDGDYRRRLELIQDTKFPVACQRVKTSRDGRFLFATGTYPPQIKVYELSQLSMKFERHLDAQIVQFQALGDDFDKLVFLRADRSIEFHARYGRYFVTRIPKFGRDMAYHFPSCDLLAVGSSREIYRLNLEQGRFLSPMVAQSSSLNVVGVSPLHGLLGVGGVEGLVEFFDPRQKQAAGKVSTAAGLMDANAETAGAGERGSEVTALRYNDDDPLQLAVGTGSGHVMLYDLRSSRPMMVKDHMYRVPIMDIKYHRSPLSSSPLILSTDQKILKIWHPDTGRNFANIEPGSELNDACVIKGTGLIFLAGEQSKISSYFIPSLGPAPQWCSFLDNLTEELEEDSTPMIYDDYKFITMADIQQLGATNLIGTSYLRAYMHGFFIDLRLYNKMKAAADPFAYDRYRKERVTALREEAASSRIRATKKKVVKRSDLQPALEAAAADSRFGDLLTDPAFSIDTRSETFKRLNPMGVRTTPKTAEAAFDHFEKVQLEGEEAEEEEGEEEEEAVALPSKKTKGQKKTKGGPALYELSGDKEAAISITATASSGKRKREKQSLEERLKSVPTTTDGLRRHTDGAMQLTFVPKTSSKKHKGGPNKRPEAGGPSQDGRQRRSAGRLGK